MVNKFKFKKNGNVFLKKAQQTYKDYTGHKVYSKASYSAEYVNSNGDTLEFTLKGIYLNNVKINDEIFKPGMERGLFDVAEDQLKQEYALKGKEYNTWSYRYKKMAIKLAVEMLLQERNA